jgi:hypothetical protein
LRTLRFDFTPREFAAIVEKFPGPEPGSVHWPNISQEVDQSPKTEEPPPELAAPVGDVPENIAKTLRRLGGLLAGVFESKDGKMPQSDFTEALTRVGVSPGEARLLSGYYRVPGSWVIDVAGMHRDLGRVPEEVEEETAKEVKREVDGGLRGVLQRYKRFVQQHRMAATAPFENYDGRRAGIVQGVRVSGIFHNEGFQIGKTELEGLLREFADGRRPEMFNYVAFGEAVRKSDIESEDVRGRMEDAPMIADMEAIADRAVGQIQQKLRARNKRIGRAFLGVRESGMTEEEFQRRIEGLDLIVRPTEIQAILRKYRIHMTDKVDWEAFCRDVEAGKTLTL